ncbi:hypothetical protein MML48_2g00003612 [Holotrichia oblita]|uniref:Uncharacterized protein n=1 Tax=Holotrichia oblita TaxID=644536 RepID=A0ACB9TQQ5_HOLOL|nr:hypothetical protein MML48_2g00003612 [Holotrichia oblita]
MSEDILVEISDKDLNLLADLYEKHQATAPHAYSTIRTCIEWREKKPDSNYVTVFGVQDTWLTTGTFIVLMQKDVMVCGIRRHISTVYDFVKELRTPIYVDVVTELYVIDKEDALKFEYTCPEHLYFARLKKSHAAQINDVWPHKSKNSQGYLEILIEMNNSLGLFLKSDDTLVCWVLRSPMGQMATLQTDVNHKRKGYASLVTKAMSKQIAQDGFNPLGTIVRGNVASETMFSGLGFRSIDTSTFVMH